MPAATILNTALYEHAPEVLEACVKRGDEMVGHGHTNAVRQSVYSEEEERGLLTGCAQRIAQHSGKPPKGWLSPWISETRVTPDLLAEAGYAYTLNWCHDDQPQPMRTRNGQTLWSIPYPQELNDIPMVVACIDPAVSAQARLLKHKPQQGFAYPGPGGLWTAASLRSSQ